jgi:hypothetical protein
MYLLICIAQAERIQNPPGLAVSAASMKSPTRQSLVFLTILFLANANAKFAPHQGCGLLSESWTVPVESLSDEINFDQVDQYLSHIENVSRPPSRSYHEEQYLPGGHCRHSDILCTSHQTRGKSAMGPYPLSPLPSVHQTIQATHGNLRMGEKTSLTEEHMEADKYLRTSITTSPSQQSSADGLDQFTKSSAPLGANDIMSFEEIERFLSGPSSPKSRKQERVEDGPRPELLSDGCRTPVGFAASYKCQRLDESFPMRMIREVIPREKTQIGYKEELQTASKYFVELAQKYLNEAKAELEKGKKLNKKIDNRYKVNEKDLPVRIDRFGPAILWQFLEPWIRDHFEELWYEIITNSSKNESDDSTINTIKKSAKGLISNLFSFSISKLIKRYQSYD